MVRGGAQMAPRLTYLLQLYLRPDAGPERCGPDSASPAPHSGLGRGSWLVGGQSRRTIKAFCRYFVFSPFLDPISDLIGNGISVAVCERVSLPQRALASRATANCASPCLLVVAGGHV